MRARAILEAEAGKTDKSVSESENPRNVLGNLARGGRFVPEPLAWFDLDRLVDIIAMGPLPRRAYDEEFVKKGWVEPYDDDQESLVAAHGFSDSFYDDNGMIRKEWIAQDSRNRYESRENPKSVKRRMRLQDVSVLRCDLFRSAASLRNVGMDSEAYMLDALGMMLGSKHRKLAETVPRLPSLASSFRSKGLDAVADALDAAYEFEMARREVAEAEDPRSVMRGFARPTHSDIVARLRAAHLWLLMNNYVGEARFIRALRYKIGRESGEWRLRGVPVDRADTLQNGDKLVRDLGAMAQAEPQKADSFRGIQRALEDALYYLRQRWS